MSIQTRWPTSDGDIVGTWTYSSGSVGYALVNKAVARDDTKYIISPTTSNCRYGFGFSAFSIPAGSTINSVSVTIRGRDVTSGTNRINGCIKIGSTWYTDATANNPGTSFISYTSTWTVSPATALAWTVAEINALAQFGVIHSDASPALRDSEVFIVVDYTEGSGYLTAGLSTLGANSFVEPPNAIILVKVNVPVSAVGKTLKIPAQGNVANCNVKLLVYDDNGGSGNPGSLLINSGAQAITTVLSWVSVSLSDIALNGNYWAGIVGDEQIRLYANSGVGLVVEDQSISDGYANPPSSWPGPFSTYTDTMSGYIEYQETSQVFIPIIFQY